MTHAPIFVSHGADVGDRGRAGATNLFAAGAAELVTDPKLTKEPLARPGEVIRKLRGSADEQLRALGAG